MLHTVDIKPLPTDVPVPRILMATPDPLARRQTFQVKVFVNNTINFTPSWRQAIWSTDAPVPRNLMANPDPLARQ